MTLFVGGVHAVGKTYVLKPVCGRLGVRYATASQLIREQRGFANWTESRKVDNLDENQRALVAAMRRLKECGETVVLDGHFVLRRDVNIHEEIGIKIFSQLIVRGVILLEASATTIANRLLQRGDATWGKPEIEVFAQRELEHAQRVCESLSLPLVRLYSPSELEVQAAFTQFGI